MNTECKQACPAVDRLNQQLAQDMLPMMMKHLGSDQDMNATSLGPFIEEFSLKMYKSVCSNRAAFQCLFDNPSICTMTSDEAKPIKQVLDTYDCMCSACPCLQTTTAKMSALMVEIFTMLFEAFGGNVDEKAVETRLLAATCPMLPGLACTNREPKCASFINHTMNDSADGLGLFSGVLGGMMTEGAQDASEMEKNCSAAGHAVDVSTCAIPGDDEEEQPVTGGCQSHSLMLLFLSLSAF